MNIIIGLSLMLLVCSVFGNDEFCKLDDDDWALSNCSGIGTPLEHTRVKYKVILTLDERSKEEFYPRSYKDPDIRVLWIQGRINPNKTTAPTAAMSLNEYSFTELPKLLDLRMNRVLINFNNVNPLAALGSLEKLEIMSSNLTEIPTTILTSLRELSELSLSNNQIGAVYQNSFPLLRRLIALDLSHNGITQIQSGAFDRVVELRTVDLSDNKLAALPFGLFQPHRELYLLTLTQAFGSNKVQLQAGIFDDLPELALLYLDHNRIEKIPKRVFDNLRRLRELDLSCNDIKTIEPGAFGRLTLEALNLSHNGIQVIENDTFNGLIVNTLRLDSNYIVELKASAFKGLLVGRLLDVRDNQLVNIERDDFELFYSSRLKMDPIRLETTTQGAQKTSSSGASMIGKMHVFIVEWTLLVLLKFLL